MLLTFMKKCDPQDLNDLRRAKSLLESKSFVVTLSEKLGKPIDSVMKKLPARTREKVYEITHKALWKALKVAVLTMDVSDIAPSSNGAHKFIVTLSGTAGGFFGLSALAVELPFSTVVMLRSICDIARSQGMDLNSPETRLECISVFGMGDVSTEKGSMNYFMFRKAIAKEFEKALEYISTKGLSEAVEDKAAPQVAKFIANISQKFGVQVSEEFAAKAIPVLGAATGGAINYAFMDHFQQKAEGHFIIKRLESIYGVKGVMDRYFEM